MAFTNTMLNAGLDGMAEQADEVSLHSDDPGSSGASEVDGGNYERAAVAWNAATGASVSADSVLNFEVPGGGTTVSWVGLWGAGDVFLGGIELNVSEVFEGDGQFAVTSLIINASNA